jgi:hypothetical protein
MSTVNCEMTDPSFVPGSLKRTENEIREELEAKSLNVFFEILNFTPSTQQIEFNLVGKDSSQEVSLQAKEIVQKHLQKWKDIFTVKK